MPTWLDLTRCTVEAFCHERGLRTFTLEEFASAKLPLFREHFPENRFPREKIRQQLQTMRNRQELVFVDGHGTYTLQTVPVLVEEVEPDKADFIRSLRPEKREYLIEVFARDRGWVALAKRHYGHMCLLPNCANTFMTPAGVPYIEVHHVVALCDGGEEALWNLSVVCAHHHRMAHFAEPRTKLAVSDTLRRLVEQRYAELLAAGTAA